LRQADPIIEAEVRLQLQWSADERTTAALQRQAKLMGFDSPTEYLLEVIATTLADNEAFQA